MSARFRLGGAYAICRLRGHVVVLEHAVAADAQAADELFGQSGARDVLV